MDNNFFLWYDKLWIMYNYFEESLVRDMLININSVESFVGIHEWKYTFKELYEITCSRPDTSAEIVQLCVCIELANALRNDSDRITQLIWGANCSRLKMKQEHRDISTKYILALHMLLTEYAAYFMQHLNSHKAACLSPYWT